MVDGKQIRSVVARRRVGFGRLLPAGRASTLSSAAIYFCAFVGAAFWAARAPPSVVARSVRVVRIPNCKRAARSRPPPPPPERHLKSKIPPFHRRRLLNAANHRRITDCTTTTKILPVYASRGNEGCSDGQLARRLHRARSLRPCTTQTATAGAETSAPLVRRPHHLPPVPTGHRRQEE